MEIKKPFLNFGLIYDVYNFVNPVMKPTTFLNKIHELKISKLCNFLVYYYSILKNQNIFLDILFNNDKDFIIYLSDYLSENQLSVKKLSFNLKFIKVDWNDLIVFNQILGKLELVEFKLLLGKSSFNDQILFEILNTLFNCETLKKIKLIMSKCEFKPNSLINFWNNLKKLRNLKDLTISLKENSLDDSELTYMNDCLEKLTNLTALNLNFECNEIKKGISGLAQSLEHLNKLKKLSLDFSGNKCNVDLSDFTNSLKKMNSLQSLEIILRSNNITFSDTIGIFETINKMANLTSLSLILFQNKLGKVINQENEVNNFVSLIALKIEMPFNLLDENSLTYVMKIITKMTNLKDLDLSISNNNIGDKTLSIITNYLLPLSHLVNLLIRSGNNRIEDSDLINLEKLSCLGNLKKLNLYLTYNRITQVGIEHIYSAMEKMPFINELILSLGNNKIGKEGSILLSKIISVFKNLKCLNLYLEQCDLQNEGALTILNNLLDRDQYDRFFINISYNGLSKETKDLFLKKFGSKHITI